MKITQVLQVKSQVLLQDEQKRWRLIAIAGFAAETDTESQRDSWSLAKIANNYRRNCEVE